MRGEVEAFAAETRDPDRRPVRRERVRRRSGPARAVPAAGGLASDDLLLIEEVDRLSRLKDEDWGSLGHTCVRVVALDLPTAG